MSHSSQPQWDTLASVRPFSYTHTQPQWAEVLSRPGWGDGAEPAVVRAAPLPPKMLCATCRFTKGSCCCRRCAVCRAGVRAGSRHHCRHCWRAVCTRCLHKLRHVHVLGARQVVCDACAAPWALASLFKRDGGDLLWGLYALRRAGEMPCVCIDPACRRYTYFSDCPACAGCTVMTQPHVERLVRPADAAQRRRAEALDAHLRAARAATVLAMAPEEVGRTFRRFFTRWEEATAFRGVPEAARAQELLLSLVSAAVCYEYGSAPGVTLELTDVPYARLLRLVECTPRYTVMEAPGHVKFVSFPGTHNWRTRLIDVNFALATRTVTAPLILGVAADGTVLHGGVRRLRTYRLHAGFAREAEEAGVPLDALVADLAAGYRLVFSGHSLGGAVAQLVTLGLLARVCEPTTALVLRGAGVARPQERITCAALGAPLVGNYQLAEHVRLCGWERCFHSLIYRTDVVPRLCCGDELTRDLTEQLADRLGVYYRNVQGWFSWRRAEPTAPRPTATSDPSASVSAPPSAGDGTGADTDGGAAAADDAIAAATDGSSAEAADALAEVVDSAIRAGRDVVTDDGDDDDADAVVDAPVSNYQRDSHRSRTSADTASTTTTTTTLVGEGEQQQTDWGNAEEEEGGEQQPELPADQVYLAALAGAAARRIRRRFACFGNFHFLEYGADGYVHTTDGEVAFGLLKRGCELPTRLLDHSVSSYNRGVMMHLYGHHK